MKKVVYFLVAAGLFTFGACASTDDPVEKEMKKIEKLEEEVAEEVEDAVEEVKEEVEEKE